MIKIASWVGIIATMTGTLASAAPVTIPSGLNPGDTYFLAFVTAGARDATSDNIADYDAFVTAEANSDPLLLALGTTWKAIASTANVDAATHVGITGPVYNLDGHRVAIGSLDLFDGALFDPNSLIDQDQHGDVTHDSVWTGSTYAGLRYFTKTLGTAATEIGINSSIGLTFDASVFVTSVASNSLYGISGPLVVPTAVPEPGTVSMMFGPLLVLATNRYRQRGIRRGASSFLGNPERR